MADTQITGVEEALKRLDMLKGAAGKRAARRALRRGANVVLKAAREGAARLDDPTTSESIARNLTVRGGGSRNERRAGGVMMRVGIRGGARDMSKYGEVKGKGKGNPGGDTWYWRMIEFGFSHRGGKQVPARPFMRRALQNNTQAATDAFANALGTEIDKELAKVK